MFRSYLSYTPRRYHYSSHRDWRYRNRYSSPLIGEDRYAPQNVHVTNYTASTRQQSAIAKATVIKVDEFDALCKQNAIAHHTDDFEITEFSFDSLRRRARKPQLVVRRGQSFDIKITFDRDYDKTKDDIKLQFSAGNTPRVGDGTSISLLVSDKDEPGKWGATLQSVNGKEATFRIMTPPDCIVAKWTLKVISVSQIDGQTKHFQYEHEEPIYMLLNPWCKDDAVYMEDADCREEYVQEDKGIVYRGTKTQISGKRWNFGQYEDFVLDCVFYLLDKDEQRWRQRGSAVELARRISALVNSCDDDGVLEGNWSGDYIGGKSPLSWCGSVKILDQYWRTKRPVKYGQCWVFSAVTTTVARALGLPCRSTTNFVSAHDCDGSLTIDRYWTPEGQPIQGRSDDSVWNFHVWNDVWIKRNDLPPGFGGWQAIDATPQELSGGIFCAGPASLKAIKAGETHYGYDAGFIFAEVNADRVNWIQNYDGTYSKTKNPNSIGVNISTKAVKSNARHDLTDEYKYPEGTSGERAAVYRAITTTSTIGEDFYDNTSQDVKFKLLDKDFALVGKPFAAACEVENISNDQQEVDLSLSMDVAFYTGNASGNLKREKFVLKLGPKEKTLVKMSIDDDDYIDKLVDMCNVKVDCMARVKGTGQCFCDTDDFRLFKPDLEVKAPARVRVGEEYEVEITITNPLKKRKLTECVFTVEGARLQTPMEQHHDDIPPEETRTTTVLLKAKRPGKRTVQVSFDSRQLSEIEGSAEIEVLAK